MGRSPKGHNGELWRIIFCYKHVWIAWVGVVYYEKCNYYVLIDCIRHRVWGELIQNYFKIFNFLLIWDKNFGFYTGWSVAKPLWICSWSEWNQNFCNISNLLQNSLYTSNSVTETLIERYVKLKTKTYLHYNSVNDLITSCSLIRFLLRTSLEFRHMTATYRLSFQKSWSARKEPNLSLNFSK